jgi:hypothetical protein
MKKEIGFFECGAQLGSGGLAIGLGAAFDDADLREILAEHFFDAIVDVVWPKDDFRAWDVLLQQSENAGCVGDVADVDGLPRGFEHDPARTILGCGK